MAPSDTCPNCGTPYHWRTSCGLWGNKEVDMNEPVLTLDGVPGAFRAPGEDWDGGDPVTVTVLDVGDDERATIAEITITHERGEASFEMSVGEAGELMAVLAVLISKHGMTIGQARNRDLDEDPGVTHGWSVILSAPDPTEPRLERIESLDDLIARASKDEIEVRLMLNGGVYSRKSISYGGSISAGADNGFTIKNHIDDTEQWVEATREELTEHTNLMTAIDRGALYVEVYE